MNELLFSLDEQHVSMDGGYSFCIEPTNYSVMYDVVKTPGRRQVIVDFKSVKREEWREGKKQWVDARLDAPLLARLEKQIQDEVDYQYANETAELIAEYHRRRA